MLGNDDGSDWILTEDEIRKKIKSGQAIKLSATEIAEHNRRKKEVEVMAENVALVAQLSASQIQGLDTYIKAKGLKAHTRNVESLRNARPLFVKEWQSTP